MIILALLQAIVAFINQVAQTDIVQSIINFFCKS